MDLRHLRYFLCVAEEMHFGRAAQRLGISQPPLSQQIRALEEELEVRLFERTSRRVRLTEAGELFAREARETIAQADRAVRVARAAQRGEIGHLRVGFTPSAPFVSQVTEALHRFRATHIEVELSLEELGRDEQIARVERRLLDIGIVRDFGRPPLPEGLEAQNVLVEDMVLALREDRPLAMRAADPTIADLRGEPLVLYGQGIGAGFNEHLIALCEQEGFRPMIAHEAGGLATLLGLVAAGFGSTVLARSLVRLHVDKLVYRTLIAPMRSGLWLIHQRDMSPTARAFIASVGEGREPRP